jgi:hypothetical protein
MTPVGESEVLQGTCLCGKVRYEIRGPPQLMYYCHCRMCRKATGTSFATNMLVRAEDFAIVAGQEAVKRGGAPAGDPLDPLRLARPRSGHPARASSLRRLQGAVVRYP